MAVITPTHSSERLQLLDALRGFALFGILLANLCSFMGLYTYTPEEVVELPVPDRIVLFFIDWFVEGKFYGIFSILFGVGFALQAARFHSASGNFKAFWWRRMGILFGIGLLHMYLVWHGDILMLYSILGTFLPLFMKCSRATLLRWIVVLLVLPLLIHGLLYMTQEATFWGVLRQFSGVLKTRWGFGEYSVLEMRTADNARTVFSVNVLKAIPRPMSYLMSGRYFQVLGLFLIGIVLARDWLPKIQNNERSVPTTAIWIGGIGLLLSLVYAIIKAIIGTPFDLSITALIQGVIYHSGSTALALGISTFFMVIWNRGRLRSIFRNLAILGRMALTNYIVQNVTAVLLFFGYGAALMRKIPFVYIPLLAIGIVCIQWGISRYWLSKFKQGPLEYIWRTLTYRAKTSS